MAKVAYVFSVSDPNSVGAFPPSIVASDWFKNFNDYLLTNGVNGHVIFDSEAALNSWLATYTLTDATLLADLAAWKSAQNVTFTSNFYTLSDVS